MSADLPTHVPLFLLDTGGGGRPSKKPRKSGHLPQLSGKRPRDLLLALHGHVDHYSVQPSHRPLSAKLHESTKVGTDFSSLCSQRGPTDTKTITGA